MGALTMPIGISLHRLSPCVRRGGGGTELLHGIDTLSCKRRLIWQPSKMGGFSSWLPFKPNQKGVPSKMDRPVCVPTCV